MSESPYLFDRRCRVLLASDTGAVTSTAPDAKLIGQLLDVTGLRVHFRVTKTLDKSPNTADVRVYNLAAKTRAGLTARGARLELHAGYASNLERVFVGDCRTIESEHHAPDWETKFQCGDGESAYVGARVLESWATKTTALDVFKRLRDRLAPAGGILTPEAEKILLAAKLEYGYAVSGAASDALSRLLYGLGLSWSIQDSRLEVTVRGEAIPAKLESVVVVSAETGMVESPHYGSAELRGKKPPVLHVKSLLQPSIRPGGRVLLKSAKHDGLHRVMKVEHYGDTAGGHWYTEMELEVIGTGEGTHA